ncbi:hypothetical protein [Streptomyces beihaiensis]|uniref:Uncharacterized protein n=1 Tax=Streptomyces beihaiensis TaxID=2984495 RepID=A0ABT3TUF9_9ACTN|nr:hypothetical protein [Streptomyces beihaiensis]MCX3060405.1 hypothetical protein [Streptomyces beihaiensis]
MMPSTCTASRTGIIAPALLATLPEVALVLALYASDYTHDRRPDLAKVAGFMVDGANRLGVAELMGRTCDLVGFWQMCRDDTTTREAWDAHRSRFDTYRLIHCTLNRSQFATVRRHLLALDAEAVAA